MHKIPELVKGELIGCPIKVTDARNKDVLGITGIVIDETKYLVVVQTHKGIKKVPKKGNTFQIKYLGKRFEVRGDILFGSPEERIKVKVKNG